MWLSIAYASVSQLRPELNFLPPLTVWQCGPNWKAKFKGRPACWISVLSWQLHQFTWRVQCIRVEASQTDSMAATSCFLVSYVCIMQILALSVPPSHMPVSQSVSWSGHARTRSCQLLWLVRQLTDTETWQSLFNWVRSSHFMLFISYDNIYISYVVVFIFIACAYQYLYSWI